MTDQGGNSVTDVHSKKFFKLRHTLALLSIKLLSPMHKYYLPITGLVRTAKDLDT
jgi:hypothetical protein